MTANQTPYETRPFFSKSSLAHLADHLSEEGEKPAAITFTKNDREEWTREHLGKSATLLSEGLRRGGLEPGGKALIFSPASFHFFTTFLAVLRAGGVVAPIDIQMSDAHIEHVFENSEATWVFATKRLKKRLVQLGRDKTHRIFLLDAEENEDDSWKNLFAGETSEPAGVGGEDEAVLFYTSGTTGKPKGVPLSHANLLSQIRTIERTGLLTNEDRMLLPLPLHHVYPVVIGVLAPLALSVPIILPYALSGNAITLAMREAGATIVLGVPRLYRAIFQGVRDKVAVSGKPAAALFDSILALSRLGDRVGLHMGRRLFRSIHRKAGPDVRILASGGSPLDPGLAKNLEALGWPMAVGYGLTETSPLLTLKWPYQGRHDSVGRAIEDVELKIDPAALSSSSSEENGNSKRGSHSEGTHGELMARGPNVFSGYHKMPEETEKSFDDGWFRTGDIADIDEQGYTYLHGRVSTMIVREGGENVDPEKVEEAYESCDEISEIGVLEDEGSLAALAVPRKDLIREHEDEELGKIIRDAMDKCAARLASYQRASRVQITSTPLERTRLGKLKRKQLGEAYEKAKAGKNGESTQRAGPVSENDMSSEDRVLMEDERVRAFWEYLAGRYHDKPLSPDAHMELDLEIDSMERIEISLAIEDQINISLDEFQLAQINYVRELMELIAEHEGDATPKTRLALTDPETVLSEDDLRWSEPRGTVQNFVASIFYNAGRLITRLFFRINLKGLENVPKRGSFIMLPNHVSLLDAPVLATALDYDRTKRCFWSGSSKLLFGNPLKRAFSRLAQIVPIEREADPVSSLAFGALILKRGHPLVWFPEGRVSPTGEPQPFRQGIGLLLDRYDRPVIPVFIDGTEKALPPNQRIPRPAEIVIHFGEPIQTQDLKARDEKAVEDEEPQKRIVRKLEESMAALRKRPDRPVNRVQAGEH